MRRITCRPIYISLLLPSNPGFNFRRVCQRLLNIMIGRLIGLGRVSIGVCWYCPGLRLIRRRCAAARLELCRHCLHNSRGADSRWSEEEHVKRTWTIIGVADVARSLKWYQSLLGLRETPPEHDYFAQALDADGTVLLCLHEWGAHEHPTLSSPDQATPGNGLL